MIFCVGPASYCESKLGDEAAAAGERAERGLVQHADADDHHGTRPGEDEVDRVLPPTPHGQLPAVLAGPDARSGRAAPRQRWRASDVAIHSGRRIGGPPARSLPPRSREDAEDRPADAHAEAYPVPPARQLTDDRPERRRAEAAPGATDWSQQGACDRPATTYVGRAGASPAPSGYRPQRGRQKCDHPDQCGPFLVTSAMGLRAPESLIELLDPQHRATAEQGDEVHGTRRRTTRCAEAVALRRRRRS